MALRQIQWAEGASLHVDLDNQGRVQALECWAAPTRAAICTVYQNGVIYDTSIFPATVPAGTQQRWSVPPGRRWAYDQLTDEQGFGAELRLA